MNTNKKMPYITREAIMSLLSDTEVARVSTAETAICMTDGDEYIDLEKLKEGVQRAILKNPQPKNTVARKSVEAATWTSIVAKLEEHGVPPPKVLGDLRRAVN